MSGHTSDSLGSDRCRCPKMVLHPAIARAKIDTCYLDTTYLNPKYCFPPQTQVMDACAVLARKLCVGLPDDAPALEIKPQIKFDLPVDIKPDINQVRQDEEERAKDLMKGWLKKEDEVKEEVKDEKLSTVEREGWKKKRTLIVMGTYSIGKERIVKCESCSRPICSGANINSRCKGDRIEDILRSTQTRHLDVSD